MYTAGRYARTHRCGNKRLYGTVENSTYITTPGKKGQREKKKKKFRGTEASGVRTMLAKGEGRSGGCGGPYISASHGAR